MIPADISSAKPMSTPMKEAIPVSYCQVERFGIDVPEAAAAKARAIQAELGSSADLHQIAPDIWAGERVLREHKDGTAEGRITYGVILYADGYEPTLNYSTGNSGREYRVGPGSVFALNARIYHRLNDRIGQLGPFAFLAWDLPLDFTLQGFGRRALRRLTHWGAQSRAFLQPGAAI